MELLRSEGVKIHFTESRPKSVASFSEKLQRPGKQFDNPLEEMPDLAGVRIILYYLDDISRVGDLIKREFHIIEEVTEHQPDHYSADQFGYLSLHYVIRLSPKRAELPEWKTFATLHAEIQVRTVLQHSWAAVSHALQYKREGDVPFRLRRKLFRLASLFELADEEFIAIRDTQEQITTSIKATSKEDLLLVRLDAPSVRQFLETSSRMSQVLKTMRKIGFTFDNEDNENDDFGKFYNVGEIVEECERLGIENIEDLDRSLEYDWETFFRAIYRAHWIVTDSFALWLLIIGAFRDSFSVEHLMSKGWHKRTAERLIDALKKIKD